MSPTTPPVSVAVLDSALTWACGCLELARATSGEVPTPCGDWDLGRLLSHLEDSVEMLTEAAEAGQVEVGAAAGEEDPGETVERLLRSTRRAREAWRRRPTSAPIAVDGLTLGRDTVALVGALEVAVHGWDVARAAGRTRPLPEDLATRLYAVALAVVTPDERGSRFGPAVPVPADAPAGHRLLAHLGRDPGPTGAGAARSGRAGWCDGADAGNR